jgi:hypothetical protein
MQCINVQSPQHSVTLSVHVWEQKLPFNITKPDRANNLTSHHMPQTSLVLHSIMLEGYLGNEGSVLWNSSW